MTQRLIKDPNVFEISRLHPSKLKTFNELGVLKLADVDDIQ